jgi:hypothetical protein
MSKDAYHDFNNDLARDDIEYDIRDYMEQFRARFGYHIDTSIFDNESNDNRFIIDEEKVSPVINIKKIVKSHDFELGLDYILVRIPSKWMPREKIKLTVRAYKKVLMLSGNKIYIDYFLFLDEMFHNYARYQKMLQRKTIIDSRKKIKDLQDQLTFREEFEDF